VNSHSLNHARSPQSHLEEPVRRCNLGDGRTAWLVTGYEATRQVLRDPRFSVATFTRPDTSRLTEAPPVPDLILEMDPPRHTRVRRLITRKFPPGYVEHFRQDIQRATDELLDAIARSEQPIDLVEQFAVPLASRSVCAWLGMPQVDHKRVRAWARPLLAFDRKQPTDALRAAEQFSAYFFDLLQNEETVPPDGFVGSLMTNSSVDEEEIFVLASFLLISGHVTTSVQLTNSILELLRHPTEFNRVLTNPAVLPHAVEELLRFTPPEVAGKRRIATEDVELAGITVRAGELVIPLINHANRDPSVFSAPDRLDVTREDRPHLSFGHGIHFCVGAQLARMELQIGIGNLIRRFPTLRLAVPESELQWDTKEQFRGLVSLPVRWRP
jgi:cytochrome P450